MAPDGRTEGRTDMDKPISLRGIVIYICSMFHEIRFRGYLVIANYMDFKSIQGL